MKKVLKYIKWFLLGLAGLIAIYLLLAILLSYLPKPGKDIVCPEKEPVYVSTNGVHLYIILPKELIRQDMLDKLNLPAGFNYLSFGWGDKKFYTTTPTWSDLSLGTAFNALFLNSDAAIHVTTYNRAYQDWQKAYICPEQIEELNNFIYSYFKIPEGEFQKIYSAKGYSADDYFYEAKGSYSFYLTSNEWVNKAMKEIEVKTSIWSPFDFGVLHHVGD